MIIVVSAPAFDPPTLFDDVGELVTLTVAGIFVVLAVLRNTKELVGRAYPNVWSRVRKIAKRQRQEVEMQK